MCNPRRVLVTATREIAEEWQRQVTRTVALDGQVTGEARVRQALTGMGEPVLRALQMRLDRGMPGWEESERGFRHAVDGGYVIFDPEREELEIVATLADTVVGHAVASTTLRGELRVRLQTEQDEPYYDDGYGGRTEATARAEAERVAARTLDAEARRRLQAAADQAEAEQAAALDGEAGVLAEQRLAANVAARRAELAEQARAHLDTVGLRARQAFNALLAEAYRDAILAYARSQGASGISCSDQDGVVDIEFFVDG